MTRIQLAIFPAILLGILAIVFVASLAKTSETVQAYTDPTSLAPLYTNAPASATALVTATMNIQAAPPVPTAAIPQTASPNPTAQDTQPAAATQSTDCSINKHYPASIRQWCVLIEKYAHTANLEPNLIAAVILQESGGDPKAYSASGAVGLMQIMPRDGLAASFQCGATACFASRPSMNELYDAEYNIAYGVRMLAALIQKNGSIRNALRAYGPMNVGYYYADKVLAIYQNYQ
jgi:soluble lytic murein transglycosylase-like protein